MKSRLKELKQAIKEILDDDTVIIHGLFDTKKNVKRGS